MLSSLYLTLTTLVTFAILSILTTAQGGVDSYPAGAGGKWPPETMPLNPGNGFGDGWIQFYTRGYGCSTKDPKQHSPQPFYFNNSGTCQDIQGHPQSDVKIFYGWAEAGLDMIAVDFFVKNSSYGCQLEDQVAHCVNNGSSCLGSKPPKKLVEGDDHQDHWCYEYDASDKGSTEVWLSYMTWPSKGMVDLFHHYKMNVTGWDDLDPGL